MAYFYEGSVTLVPSFTSSLDFQIVYSCVTTGKFDWCGDSAVSFDSNTGIWTLATVDKVTYPPGLYSMTITAAFKDYPKSSTSTMFTINLIDPCATAAITEDAYSATYAYDLVTPIETTIPFPTVTI